MSNWSESKPENCIWRQAWSEIPEIIQSAINRAEPLPKNFHIQILLEKDLPFVKADSKLLAEVFYNLLDNAVKYAPPETAIEFSARRTDNETVESAVADEAATVAEELREKIDWTTLFPSVKWKFHQNEKKYVALMAGTNIYLPVCNRAYNIGSFSYNADSKTISKNRLTVLTIGAFASRNFPARFDHHPLPARSPRCHRPSRAD